MYPNPFAFGFFGQICGKRFPYYALPIYPFGGFWAEKLHQESSQNIQTDNCAVKEIKKHGFNLASTSYPSFGIGRFLAFAG